LHEIIWAADPKNDSLEGLIGHISHYAEEFFNACAIRCEVMAPENIPIRHISAGLRHNLFLAVKEAVNNAAKHAKATRVLVQISLRAQQLEILVSDNGGGFKMEAGIDVVPGRTAHTCQHGLVNMKTRLASINGRCEVNSEEGQGTTVRFVIPLAA
jgi:signal transduction histidine kinase